MLSGIIDYVHKGKNFLGIMERKSYIKPLIKRKIPRDIIKESHLEQINDEEKLFRLYQGSFRGKPGSSKTIC